MIGITYKPWRLFFIACSFPNLVAVIILIFLPESPKFVLGQGDESGAYEILRKMHRINTGKTVEFEVFDIYEELESIESQKRRLECSQKSRFPFFSSVWTQTIPLFRPPYLLATLILCGTQFSLYAISSGFFMFFADILNRMVINLKDIADPRMPMCEVINLNTAKITTASANQTIHDQVSSFVLKLSIWKIQLISCNALSDF